MPFTVGADPPLFLTLPLAPRRTEPQIADTGDVVHQRRPDLCKLPADFTDAKLLTKVLST
jgi:hypothetical protein